MADESSLTKARSKLAYDLLGPSAKYVGKRLLDLTKASFKNIERVAKLSRERRKQLGIEGGTVAPRVIPLLLQSAALTEDEIVASYIGGVLCSARTPNGRDDRAIAMLKVMEGLSTYALRAHCIVYSSALRQRSFKMSDVRKWLLRGNGVTVVIDEAEFQEKMQFSEAENADTILEHAFVNLSANDLCMQGVRAVRLKEDDPGYRWMHLTLRGAELFCWGAGMGQSGIDAFFSQQELPTEINSLSLVPRKFELGLVQFG